MAFEFGRKLRKFSGFHFKFACVMLEISVKPEISVILKISVKPDTGSESGTGLIRHP